MLHHIRKKTIRNTSEALSWEILPRAGYSPDLAPSDYHLFVSVGHALAEQRFDTYKDVKKWFDEWFSASGGNFYRCSIHKFPVRWENI